MPFVASQNPTTARCRVRRVSMETSDAVLIAIIPTHFLNTRLKIDNSRSLLLVSEITTRRQAPTFYGRSDMLCASLQPRSSTRDGDD